MKNWFVFIIGGIIFYFGLFFTPTNSLENAENLNQQGKYDEANAIYTNLINNNKDVVDAYFNRAFNYYHLNEIKKSNDDYLKILEIDSTNVLVNVNLGIGYNQLEKYDKAIECYNNALKRESWKIRLIGDEDPYSVPLWDILKERGTTFAILAMKYSKEDYAKQAVLDLKQGLSSVPKEELGDVYNNLGLMNFNLKKVELGCYYWKRGVDLKDKFSIENYETHCLKTGE